MGLVPSGLVESLLFQPPRPPSYTNTPNFFQLVTTHNSSIQCFFVQVENPAYTILFSHGNAEDIGMIFEWFKEIALQLNCNVFGYDYTGYGLSYSEVGPAEKYCFSDIQAAFDYLTGTEGILARDIILYGRSLGSGASCELAMRQSAKNDPVGGVILQSPLMSAYRVAFNFKYTMPGDMMCNIDKVPHINSLVFVIHGNRDEIVPFFHGEELYLGTKVQYRYEPFWVDGAGHNNIEMCVRKTDPQLFFQKLRDFLEYARSHPEGHDMTDAQVEKKKKAKSYSMEDHLFCCAKGNAGYYDDDEDGGERMTEYHSDKLTIHTPRKAAPQK